MMAQIGFGIVAACMCLSAFLVVTGKNLVHSVLWLGTTLLGTAVLFVMLRAPFLAGVQVLLYAGGILTLMLFGVMLTHRHERLVIVNEQNRRGAGATAAAVLFGILAAATYRTPLPATMSDTAVDTKDLGRAILTDHLLAFEVLSLLLLAAMVGAIVLARRRDHTSTNAEEPNAASPTLEGKSRAAGPSREGEGAA